SPLQPGVDDEAVRLMSAQQWISSLRAPPESRGATSVRSPATYPRQHRSWTASISSDGGIRTRPTNKYHTPPKRGSAAIGAIGAAVERYSNAPSNVATTPDAHPSRVTGCPQQSQGVRPDPLAPNSDLSRNGYAWSRSAGSDDEHRQRVQQLGPP